MVDADDRLTTIRWWSFLGLAVIFGVPFGLGCAAMALPVNRVVKAVIALAPVAVLVLTVTQHFFWLGEIGGVFIVVIATWSWLLGVALSGDVRSTARFVARLARA